MPDGDKIDLRLHRPSTHLAVRSVPGAIVLAAIWAIVGSCIWSVGAVHGPGSSAFEDAMAGHPYAIAAALLALMPQVHIHIAREIASCGEAGSGVASQPIPAHLTTYSPSVLFRLLVSYPSVAAIVWVIGSLNSLVPGELESVPWMTSVPTSHPFTCAAAMIAFAFARTRLTASRKPKVHGAPSPDWM